MKRVAGVRASAGSGKTWSLTTRYLALLHAGARLDGILATTFTRKAAGEILGRVLARLAAAADDPGKRDELREALEVEQLDAATCRALLAGLARRLDRLAIGTLDSFFQRLARCFRHDLGLPPAGALVDERSELAGRLRRRALHEVFDAAAAQGSLGEWHERLDALRPGKPARAVAERLEKILEDLYDVWREAPDEARWSRVPEAPGALRTEELAGFVAALREAGAGAGGRVGTAAAKMAELAELGRWEEVFSGGLGKSIAFDGGTYYRTPLPESVLAPAEPIVAHARAVVIAQIAARGSALYDVAQRFGSRFDELRRREGVQFYGDVPLLLAGFLAGRPLEEIDHRLDARVEHLLLDEFQDTDPRQWAVLKRFATRIAGDDEAQRTFFCVGDAKQAIYGWRGATPAIFDRLSHDLAGLEWEELNRSYRSSPHVLWAVDSVFESIGGAGPVRDKLPAVAAAWESGYAPHTAHRDELPGYVELVSAPAAAGREEDDRAAGTGAGAEAEDDDTAAAGTLEFAARRVKELCGSGAWPAGATIGVLLRTNNGVRRMLYELGRVGVPASGEGSSTLVDEPAVEAVLAAFTLADHPGSTIAAFHLSHTPLGRAIDPDLAAGGTLDESRRARVSHGLRARLARDGYGAVVAEWAGLLAPSCGPRGVRRLAQLVEVAEAYDAEATLRPADFVGHALRAQVEEPAPAPVRVLSIHRAKGLEFDAVVLPELEWPLVRQGGAVILDRPDPGGPVEAVFPSVSEPLARLLPVVETARTLQRTREGIESLCLLYVAMTRARCGLYMVVQPRGTGKGGNLLEGRLRPAAILRAGLGVGDEDPAGGRVLFADGEADWFARAGPAPDERRSAPPDPSDRPVLRFAGPAGAAVRGARITAPSALERGGRVAADELLGLVPSNGRRFGSLIHAFFSCVGFSDDAGGTPTDDALVAAARRELPDAEETWVREQLPGFRRMLRTPAVHSALARPQAAAGQTIELLVEHPFAVDVEGVLVRGRFDRVVVRRDGGRVLAADLLDFKTDAAEGAAVDEVVENYRPQMDAYRAALAAQYGLPPERVTARLLFVGPGIARPV